MAIVGLLGAGGGPTSLGVGVAHAASQARCPASTVTLIEIERVPEAERVACFGRHELTFVARGGRHSQSFRECRSTHPSANPGGCRIAFRKTCYLVSGLAVAPQLVCHNARHPGMTDSIDAATKVCCSPLTRSFRRSSPR